MVVVAAGQECVLYEWRKKCIHMVMEETKGKEREKPSSIRHKGPRARLAAGRMDAGIDF